ncbi:MFS transporter [Microlunatus sp. Y2014]|uniref:MFS transporter n=1 Tax=Microlunatus sp. Y2014 TaxID=3418488 RepID=UPI003DA6DBDE
MPPSTQAVLSTSTSVDRLSAPINHRRPPRRWPASLAALEVRNYRLFLGAQAIGSVGGWMQRVAQDWMVLQLTGSVAMVGLVVALQFLPFLLFGLFSGVIADRYPKKRILQVTQAAAALCALVLGVLALTGTAQAWHVFVIAFVLGVVMVIDNPARSALVTELVGAERIRNAVSLNSSVFHSAALVGPALSGILIGTLGLGWSFIANAVATAAVVVVISMIRPAISQLPTAASRAKGQLRQGLAYIRRTSEIRWALVLLAVAGFLTMNIPVVVTAFSTQVFDLGVNGYSLLISLNAVGALSGALLSAGRKKALRLRELAALLGLLGLLIAVGSQMPNGGLYGLTLVAGGLVSLTFLIGANTLVQTASAPALRGRVMAVYILVQMGMQALGSPILGFAMDTIGPRTTVLISGLATLALAGALALAMARQSNLSLGVAPVRRADLHLDPLKLGRATVRGVTPRTLRRLVPLEIVPARPRPRHAS